MTVYAGQYGAEAFFAATGGFYTSSAVVVRLRGTATAATLYTDRTKAVEAANPFTTDEYGNGTFYADAGNYDLIVNGATVPVQVPKDAAEPPSFDATEDISYDADGNVESVTEGGVTTTYTYDDDGNVATETRAGLVRTWTYDTDGNPVSSTVDDA